MKMYVRKRFDIGWTSLFAGLGYVIKPDRRDHHEQAVETAFQQEGPALACLSVRTGFDLFLSTVDWPKGTEVIMTAITIPAMGEIVEHHGFVPVAVDVDTRHVHPNFDAIEAAISPRTRAIVVAHLFGTRSPLEQLKELATRHNLLLIEDCAQCYDGRPRSTKSPADISMYSFGTLKTATAFGGAVLIVQDLELLQKMRITQATYPVLATSTFATKLLKYMFLSLLSLPIPYGIFIRVLAAFGKDHDILVRNFVKGFSGPRFFESIRQRPCGPQLALLHQRLTTYDPRRVAARQATGQQLANLLSPNLTYYGCTTTPHTYWLFAMVVANPDTLITALRHAGFDATSASSTLIAIDTNLPKPPPITQARYGMDHIVYLPLYPEMPTQRLTQMAQVINDVAQAANLPDNEIISTDRRAEETMAG